MDSDVSDLLRLVEGRMTVAQVQELFQVPHVLTDIDHLESGIPFDLFLHPLAVGAGMHYEHLYHSLVSLRCKYTDNQSDDKGKTSFTTRVEYPF